ncbi:phytoene desaturase family protein [Williamsia sp. MIQD14]|uniref:phytoene desaturase family protein n=1 Tax=Williamsia sp. MIQD14 TaxID=3425703 RepID=UPI003DA04863
MSAVDAVVIGAGHNGLVAAIRLADAGWDVVLLEQHESVGGAVRSAELTPGYVSDLYSAFYPLASVSPALRGLDLGHHGLTWSRAPIAFGHPLSPDDTGPAVVHRDAGVTAAALAAHDARDGRTWVELTEQWRTIGPALIDTLFRPFPPVRGPWGLLRALEAGDLLRLARFLTLPASRMVTELFRDPHAQILFLGNAMHADIPLDAPGSGLMGYLLTMLGQDTGFPVPVGGAFALSEALASRARAAGVEILTGTAVDRIDIEDGRARGVRTRDGRRFRARRAVLADVDAPTLLTHLVGPANLPARVVADLERFDWDMPVVKVNYAVRAPIPWTGRALSEAGTVHLGADRDQMVRWMADLTTGVVPRTPFLLFGQMTTSDPTRSPSGTESAWAYTHLPRGITDEAAAQTLADRVDEVVEAHAPGFTDLLEGRHVQTPRMLADDDPNLHGGAVNGGTAQLHQQLVFRPVPGTGRPETPVDRLYLAGASAHPGGGVHGACGNNAARAALAAHGIRGLPRRTVISLLDRRLTN